MTSAEVLSRFVAVWPGSLDRVLFEIEELPFGWHIRTRYLTGTVVRKRSYALSRTCLEDAQVDVIKLAAEDTWRLLCSDSG